MDGSDSSAVLEEVEALFQKLQHLPASIRQKALSCIQEKLPDKFPSKEGEDAGGGKTVQSPKNEAQPTEIIAESSESVSKAVQKASPISKPTLQITQKASVVLSERQAKATTNKLDTVKVKSEEHKLKEDMACSSEEQGSGTQEPDPDKKYVKPLSTVRPVFKVISKKPLRNSSGSYKANKTMNIDKESHSSSQEKDSNDGKAGNLKKKQGAKIVESSNVSKEDSQQKPEVQAEEKCMNYEEKLDSAESENLSSPEISSANKLKGHTHKSAKSAKKIAKVIKIEPEDHDDEDDAYDDKPISSSAVKDSSKPFFYDDGGPVFVLEDIRTLSGRKTKRLNLASLSGFRKPRVKVSASPKDAKSNSGSPSTPGRPRGSSQKVKADVPSEVAESAEILASLSSGIPHKEGGSSVECLKDKTNNQRPVITYEFEALADDENTCKEDEEHLAEGKEQFVDVADTLIENVDSDVERDPLEDAEKNASGEYTCNFCDFKSTSKQSLSAHVRKHKENIPKPEHVCPECNKKFSQSCSLQLHLKRHRGERDFHCPDCDYKAFTKVDLTRHQTIHTGERNKVCEYCGKTFAKDSTLRDHVKSVHERKVKHACEMCGFVTHRANNLRVHIRMRHHGEYNNHVCPVCKASVKQKNAFLEHMRSHTGERPFKCESCPAAFACLARLNVHRNAVHGERQFKCEDCEKSFQTKHHLLRHRAIHTKERPYACPYCSYACNTQGNIAKHVRSIHNLPDFSYRRHKDLLENGGQPREIDPEWVKKGEEVTEEYLNELSAKMGRTITLDELWSKQEELTKKREEQIKARQEAKERRAVKNEAAGAAYLEKVRKRRLERQQAGESGKKIRRRPRKESDEEVDPDDCADDTDVPLYKLVSQGGNIRLCLETDEVQVYTGDATREVPLYQVKENDMSDSDEIQTIQGYMNDDGQFVRIEDGVLVDEDSSTVVVIIDSDMQQEIDPDIMDVMEVTCEEDLSTAETEALNLNVVSSSKGDIKNKPSVLRVIKQEL